MPVQQFALRRLKKPEPFGKDAPEHVNALRFAALARGALDDPERAAKALQAAPFLYVWARNFYAGATAPGPLLPHGDLVVFAPGYCGPVADALAALLRGAAPREGRREDAPGGDLPAGWIETDRDAPGTALATAVGIAVGRDRSGANAGAAKTWCVLAQDEVGSGAFYEAAQLAGARQTPNLVCLADCAGVDAAGFFSDHGAPDLPGLMAALGWKVVRANDATDLKAVSRALMRATVASGPVFVPLGTVAAHGTAAAGTYLAHRPPAKALALAELEERFGAKAEVRLPEGMLREVSSQHASRLRERAAWASAHPAAPAASDGPGAAAPEPDFSLPVPGLLALGRNALLTALDAPLDRNAKLFARAVNACGMRAAGPFLWRGLAFSGAGAPDYACDPDGLWALALSWRFRRPPATLAVCVGSSDQIQRAFPALEALREAGFAVFHALDAATFAAKFAGFRETGAPTLILVPPGPLPPTCPPAARRLEADAPASVRTFGLSAKQNVELAGALDRLGARFAFAPLSDLGAMFAPVVGRVFCVGVPPARQGAQEAPGGDMPVLVKSARLSPAQIAQAIVDLCAAREKTNGER